MASASQKTGIPGCGFFIAATKAGDFPLSIEKRANRKNVTIINNVRGNAGALCKTLTTMLGTGDTVHQKGPIAEVEIQGEQIERVKHVLLQLGCVRGLAANKD